MRNIRSWFSKTESFWDRLIVCPVRAIPKRERLLLSVTSLEDRIVPVTAPPIFHQVNHNAIGTVVRLFGKYDVSQAAVANTLDGTGSAVAYFPNPPDPYDDLIGNYYWRTEVSLPNGFTLFSTGGGLWNGSESQVQHSETLVNEVGPQYMGVATGDCSVPDSGLIPQRSNGNNNEQPLSDKASEKPVRYLDGQIVYTETDLESSGMATPWRQTRSWSGARGGAGAFGSRNGSGWANTYLPTLRPPLVNDSSRMYITGTGSSTTSFRSSGSNWVPADGGRSSLVLAGGEWRLTDDAGNQYFFESPPPLPAAQQGHLKRYVDRSGVEAVVTQYSPTGDPMTVRRQDGSTVEFWDYTYANVLLTGVTLRRSTDGGATSQAVRSVEYRYYGIGDTAGNASGLKAAIIHAGNLTGEVLGTTYYRYYTETVADGFEGALKFVVSSDAFDRLTGQFGITIDTVGTLTDAQVATVADNYFKYDGSGRVIQEVAQGAGCSVCTGGQGTFTYAYFARPGSNSNDYASDLVATNEWRMRTTVTKPDGNKDIVYTNKRGDVMLREFLETATLRKWLWYSRFDDMGRVVLEADPVAVTGFDESQLDLVRYVNGNADFLSDTAGKLISRTFGASVTATASSPGDVTGYLQSIRVLHGEVDSTPSLMESQQYFSRTVTDAVGNLVTIYTVASELTYPIEGTVALADASSRLTSYSYAWRTEGLGLQPYSVTSSQPVVSVAQNGLGVAATSRIVSDRFGRPIWTRDQEGVLGYSEYDTGTGAVLKNITDVDTTRTADFSNLPTGWSTPAGGGTHLQSKYRVDGLGRTTATTWPSGRIDYTVYRDANREVRQYNGWTGSTTTGPVIVERYERFGGSVNSSPWMTYTEQIQMAPPSIVVDAFNAPTGTEPIAGITSLNRNYQNLAGQVIWHDAYTNLDGVNYSVGGKAVLALGTSGVQFDRSVFTFDNRGRKNRITSPAGVISRTDFDGLGRATGEWVGTNDGTSGDMTQVSKFEYDGGLVGNGTLTALTLYPGNGASPRVTRSAYDWRNRLIAVKAGNEASELTSSNRPVNYFTLNNLGELTDRRVFDGDGVTIVDANGDGIPDPPAASLLRSKNSYSIDGLGQVYREEFYGANSTTGALTTTPTVMQYWFSDRGELVKTLHPGGFVEKFRFDGAGRLTGLFGTDGGGDANAADARTLSGDLVLRQAESSYDVDGHLIQVVQRDRYFGESGTGPLGDSNTTGTRARVDYTAFYYDGAGRRKADVEIGTNGGISWTRPANPPASSNTALVGSYGYDSAGRLVDATDPSGAVVRTTYDMQARQVSSTRAYGTIPLTTTQSYANGRLATVTEPGNRVTRISYDPLGRTVTASERDGTPLARTTVTTANALGDIISVVDAAQMKVTFGYDAIGRKLNVVEASGTTLSRITWTAYDALGRVIAVTDPRNFTTWTSFNDVTRTKTVLDPLNHSTIQTYDLEGRQISLTDARGFVHGTSYDLLGRVTAATSPLPSSQTAVTQQQYLVGGDTNRTIDPLGHARSTTFDRFDRVSKRADPLGNATQWAYDRNGRVVTITDPKGTQFATDYDLLGRTIQTRDAAGTPIQQTATFSYDATNGDLNATTDYRGSVTTFGRDTAGRLTSLSNASNTTYSFTTTYAYDALDRVVSETRPGSRVTTQTFDVLGRKTSVKDVAGAAFKETKYGYDAGDNLINTTDPLGKITFHAYNGAGQRWATTDRNNATTLFSYDNEGRTIQVTDAGGNATYSAFDEAGRQYAATDGAGKTKWFVYDAADRRTSWADRNGRVSRRAYDDADRVTAESWELSGVTIQTQTFAYDANGNTTSATDPDGNHTLTYDALDRVATSQQPFSFGLTYAYSPTGDTVTTTDTSGGSQVSSFDKRGRLTTREQSASGMRVTFGYDSKGDPTTEVREGKSGASWVGAGSTYYQFDGYGRATLVQASNAAGAVVSQYWTAYDNGDRVTSESIAGTTRWYGYDAEGQLTSDGGTAISYDAAGNRNGSGYTKVAGNRIASDGTWTYSYDSEGNQVGKSKAGEIWTYTYDHRNQMTLAERRATVGGAVVASVANAYDALGNRVRRVELGSGGASVSDVRFGLDGWDSSKPRGVGTENFDAVVDRDASGAVLVRRLFGSGFDAVLSRSDASGVRWYGTDRLGTVHEWFDASGVRVGAVVQFDGYGTVVSGALSDRYGFTGREWDSVVGLQYSRARWYSPTQGRFTSEDPLGLRAGDANFYRYVGNQPTGRVDPSGLDWIDRFQNGWDNLGKGFRALPAASERAADQFGEKLDNLAHGRLNPDFVNGLRMLRDDPAKNSSKLAGIIVDDLTKAPWKLGEGLVTGDGRKIVEGVAGTGLMYFGAKQAGELVCKNPDKFLKFLKSEKGTYPNVPRTGGPQTPKPLLANDNPLGLASPNANIIPDKLSKMTVEDYSLLGGRNPGKEFVVPGKSVPEMFSARLPNGSGTLIVTGTESLGQGVLANRLRLVQELAGGPTSFNKITGLASDNLENLIRSGKFVTRDAAELLGSKLGGKWTVTVVERPGQTGVFDVIAERVGK